MELEAFSLRPMFSAAQLARRTRLHDLTDDSRLRLRPALRSIQTRFAFTHIDLCPALLPILTRFASAHKDPDHPATASFSQAIDSHGCDLPDFASNCPRRFTGENEGSALPSMAGGEGSPSGPEAQEPGPDVLMPQLGEEALPPRQGVLREGGGPPHDAGVVAL